MRPLARLLPALAAAALLAAPARAQTGNQTDIPFNPPPGGISGSYLGPGARFENELLLRAGDRVGFRDAAAGCAARRAVLAWSDSTARRPRTGAEHRVDLLLTRSTGGETEVRALAAALRGGTSPDSPTGVAALELARALDGLFLWRCECPADVDDYTEAGQWDRALQAYGAFIEAAPPALFSPPSPELLAVNAALGDALGRTFLQLR
ncbi:MAG TPA: hypothetical protein VFR81_09835 [Longimicrobium sp.]|nr:hypothetical protein [Longimicrobium sp.]